jgi:myosin heavy subunit
MTFDLQKYLIENNLTLTGKIRMFEGEDQEETSEPTEDDMKSTDKEMKDLDNNKKELEKLQAKAKDIIFKYTIDTPQGRKVKGSISDYNKAIGDIPNKIKQLKKKIDAVENPTSSGTED